MDVSAPAGTPIFLPTVKGNVIRWSYLREERGRSEAIQKYAGTDEKTGEKYYIQFHHTVSGSGNLGLHQSGEVGGRVNTNHVHIQFASGNSEWLDASKYFCAR
ncbi:MAG: hypothetical protein COU27_01635 [Candidatus Levybacteria bacterium CG10_big_fil_rev_8_21_14_0_10_36_7]|nr:MAG: hypothetical protein COU27_01635 [Candidatus Levybacteria bacterium CG10_big_fil_rev_8_21_14_0_10_36_7]